MNLSVFGAGSWGTAIAQAAALQGLDVTLWCRDPEQADKINKTGTNPKRLTGHPLHQAIKATAQLEEAARHDLWITATPAQTLRSLLTDLRPHAKSETKILNASKGIEIASQLLPHEIAAHVLPECSFGDLSGPSHAEEVIKGLPACLVVACADEEDALFWQKTLNNERFRLYASTDLLGVEVGGAVKNVIAIASGFLHQRNFGDNAAAALVTRGLAEMTRLGLRLGARPDTFSGLAGIGDLMVTSFSEHSRNFRLGRLLGSGFSLDEAVGSLGQVAEGVPTAQALMQLTEKLNVDMPLCRATYQVIHGRLDGDDVLPNLMGRRPKWESESY